MVHPATAEAAADILVAEEKERRQAPRFDVITPDEARAWIAERTGPKGGRNYKRCQRCAPAM
ncbi:hypothetical protein [Streptomyces sp. NPDC005538]|uniref:hypothetical protein n=1 Tax=Streptomyces sp. NPDC005538 TaxID=3157043 RepID=UPI0033BC1261